MDPRSADSAEVERLNIILARGRDKVQWFGAVSDFPENAPLLLAVSIFRISIYKRSYKEIGEEFASRNLINSGHLFDLQTITVTRNTIVNFSFSSFGSIAVAFDSEDELFKCMYNIVNLQYKYGDHVKFSFIGITREDILHHFAKSMSYKEVESLLGSFEEIFEEETSVYYLRQNMFRQESIENLDFIENWKMYKRCAGVKKKEMKKTLYFRFFDKKAPDLLNIEYGMRRQIAENIHSNDPEMEMRLFDGAHEAVMQLLREDTYMKFVGSKEGRVCAFIKKTWEDETKFQSPSIYDAWCSYYNIIPKEFYEEMFGDIEGRKLEIKDYSETKLEYTKAIANTLKSDTKFEKLIISRPLVKEIIKVIGEVLLDNKTIRELRILRTRLDVSDMKILSRSITNNVHNNLETIDFSHSTFLGRSFASLAILMGKVPLKEFILVNCGGTPRTMGELFLSMSKNIHLQSTLHNLDLSHNKFGYSASHVFSLQLLPKLRSIRKLHMRDTVFELSEIGNAISIAPTFSYLENVDFSYNNISTTASSHLSTFLSNLPKLRVLTLASTGIRMNAVSKICTALRNRGTTGVEMNLDHNKVKPNEVHDLANAFQNLDVNLLLISGMQLNPSQMVDVLAVVSTIRNLKVLDIGGNIRRSKCNDSISELQYIGRALGKMESLTKLKLGWRDPLADSDKPSKKYNFGNSISYILDGLEESKSLAILDVSRNYIENLGFNSLSGYITRSDKLLSIKWGGNKLSLHSLMVMTRAIIASKSLATFEIPKKDIMSLKQSEKGMGDFFIEDCLKQLKEHRATIREKNKIVEPNLLQLRRFSSSESYASTFTPRTQPRPIPFIGSPQSSMKSEASEDSFSPMIANVRHLGSVSTEASSVISSGLKTRRYIPISDTSDDDLSGLIKKSESSTDLKSLANRKLGVISKSIDHTLSDSLQDFAPIARLPSEQSLRKASAIASSPQYFSFSTAIRRRSSVEYQVDSVKGKQSDPIRNKTPENMNKDIDGIVLEDLNVDIFNRNRR